MKFYENVEVTSLILRCRERDDSAFSELLARYTPMLRKVVSGFSTVSLEFDELFSEACVAIHSAALRYDLSQGDVTFGLYARICAYNRIVDLLRLRAKEPVIDFDVELVSDAETIELGIVRRETIERLINSAHNLLSDYEYRVLMLHIQGYKTSAIADMLSRTPKSVDNAKSRIFRRLRSLFDDVSDT